MCLVDSWTLNLLTCASIFLSVCWNSCIMYCSVCVYLCTSVHACIHTYICVQRLMLGVFLHHAPWYALRQELSLNLELTYSANWVISSPKGSPVSAFPRLGLQVPVPAEVACSARTLLTHLPSLWPVHCCQLLLVLRFPFWPVWSSSTWWWLDRHLRAIPSIFKWQILSYPMCLAAPYW